MLKVVLFLLAGCAFVAVAWLLAGISGHVVASIGAYTIETSTPIAILAVPRIGAGWRRRHRLALGDRIVTRVLVALAADEPAVALKEARRAQHLLGDSPQTLLLVAEAARLSEREGEAEEAFRALVKQRDASFLGLRGLLRQAADRRDWSEAQVIAKQAEAAHPGTAWLRLQRAELALQTENWAEALELIGSDPRRSACCVAAADAESDPTRALSFAKQAWKQDPAFVPAVLAYASRLRAANHEKRAQYCVTDAWKRAPHPDLAAFALAPEPDNLSRARAGKRLALGNPTHPESRLLLARVALDAGLTGEARHQVEIAEKEGMKQRRLCLLLAEIEEKECGDTETGRVAQRDALRRATSAEPDPHWQCTTCRTDHAVWHPKCDVCGGVGTVQWSSIERTSGLSLVAV
jgi:HemY protein